ncbi:MAG: hypothetical protein N3D74_06700, partial [Caldisericia bacterium]|nr:hypothetical protein [Caldisericia bacterium]
MIYILFNKKTKSIISFIIINSLLCNFSFNIKTINAKTKSQIQNEINKKQKELENNKKKIVILEDKKKAINEEIQKTQLEINNLNNQINS